MVCHFQVFYLNLSITAMVIKLLSMTLVCLILSYELPFWLGLIWGIAYPMSRVTVSFAQLRTIAPHKPLRSCSILDFFKAFFHLGSTPATAVSPASAEEAPHAIVPAPFSPEMLYIFESTVETTAVVVKAQLSGSGSQLSGATSEKMAHDASPLNSVQVYRGGTGSGSSQ